MNIFVGNLLFEAAEEDVKRLFEGFGKVEAVAIVMEKNGKKSRGFGFVEMPDIGEAQAAIAGLDAKEFMGRILIVSPARPKSDAEKKAKKEQRLKVRLQAKAKALPVKEDAGKNAWYAPVFNNTAGKKIGRRTRRFLEKLSTEGVNAPLIRKKRHPENPMRWKKKQEQPKPWQKNRGKSKPWDKKEGGHNPGKKVSRESNSWQKRSPKGASYEKK